MNDNFKNSFAAYQVSLKVLFKKGDAYLFLRDAVTGFLDLPGGRIEAAENDVPLEEILRREIIEEIGDGSKYEIKEPVFQFRAARNGADVFITVYEADYLSGEVVLSPEHDDIRWINLDEFGSQKELFLSNEGQIALKKYLKKQNPSKL